MTGVLFVCTGNICRSPTAHGVFEHLVAERGLQDRITTDSAATHDYHPGKPPDPRTIAAAARRGFDLSHLRARTLSPADYEQFDYLLAMDRSHVGILRQQCPRQFHEKIALFMAFAPELEQEIVPDPYFGDDTDFELVLDLVEPTAKALLHHVIAQQNS